jgi:hypothetical protein
VGEVFVSEEYESIEAVREEMWRRREEKYKRPANIIQLTRPVRSIRNVTDEELTNLLTRHTQAEVGAMFGVTQMAVSKRLARTGVRRFALRRRQHF